MSIRRTPRVFPRLAASLLCLVFASAGPVLAQATARAAAATSAAPTPAQAWPREVQLPNALVLIYQPQVTSWVDNRIAFRTALAIKPKGAAAESFGTIFATASTRVNKSLRTVVFEDLQVTKSTFPALPDNGAAYVAALQKQFGASVRSIALDRLKLSPTVTGATVKPVAVQNPVPRVIVSNAPAILVPVDGAPALRPVASNPRYQRVINTRALLVRDTVENYYFLKVFDGWVQSPALDLPWTRPFITPPGLDAVARSVASSRLVDMMAGDPRANPPPTLANGVPQIFIGTTPAELIVFDGAPQFVPIAGTSLRWATNTGADVLQDATTNAYYALLAGRWFTSAALTGPWSFVASNALPADFARIPATSLAGAVLPAVAGTKQAKEALVDNAIPQTAAVPRANGPSFKPEFDGAPQFAPIPGTPLNAAVNTLAPVIRTPAGTLYAVKAGVWFTAAQATGPWTIATSVPAEIYTIPPASPLHFVTYARVYSATADVVHVGYTPGYLGTAVEPTGTVVYGTGYRYTPWIGNAWYPQRPTYGVSAAPVYNPNTGFTYSFALGLAASASMPANVGGGTVYHPSYWGGYPCCASASANIYLRPAVARPPAATAIAAAPAPVPSTPVPATPNVARGSDQTAAIAKAPARPVRPPNTAALPPPVVLAQAGSLYQLPSSEWQAPSTSNDTYADNDGNVYRNSGGTWQKHAGSGWSNAPSDTQLQQEAQSREEGAIQAASYSMSNATRFSGNAGDGWNARDAGDGGYSRTLGGSGGISAERYNYNQAVLNNEFTMWQNGLMAGDNLYYGGMAFGAVFPLP